MSDDALAIGPDREANSASARGETFGEMLTSSLAAPCCRKL